MGGRLSAESDGPGRGATFILELPLAAARGREHDSVSHESRPLIFASCSWTTIRPSTRTFARSSSPAQSARRRARCDGGRALRHARAGAGSRPTFEIDSAYQGKEALENWRAPPQEAGRPYALAFVDVRMPPGWDGVETIEQLWQVDPALQVRHLHGLLGLLVGQDVRAARHERQPRHPEEALR